MPQTAIVVLVTVASEEQGRTLAEHLVAEGLCACVNVVGPIRSIYRWQGEIQSEAEYQLLIKTRRDLFAAVESRIRALHSYDTPEVLALPVEAASEPYLAWITASTRA